jgi:hypothetical protein
MFNEAKNHVKSDETILHMGTNAPVMNVTLKKDYMSFCPKIIFSYK